MWISQWQDRLVSGLTLQWNTYEELVAKGEQKLNAVHLFIRFERKLQLEVQKVQLPVLVQVLFSHLYSDQMKMVQDERSFSNEKHSY